MNYGLPHGLKKERRYNNRRQHHRSTPKPHNLPPLGNVRARGMNGIPEPQQFVRITPRQGAMDNNGHHFFRGPGGPGPMGVNPRRGRGGSIQHDVAPVVENPAANMWHNNLESWMNAKGGDTLGGEESKQVEDATEDRDARRRRRHERQEQRQERRRVGEALPGGGPSPHLTPRDLAQPPTAPRDMAPRPGVDPRMLMMGLGEAGGRPDGVGGGRPSRPDGAGDSRPPAFGL